MTHTLFYDHLDHLLYISSSYDDHLYDHLHEHLQREMSTFEDDQGDHEDVHPMSIFNFHSQVTNTTGLLRALRLEGDQGDHIGE